MKRSNSFPLAGAGLHLARCLAMSLILVVVVACNTPAAPTPAPTAPAQVTATPTAASARGATPSPTHTPVSTPTRTATATSKPAPQVVAAPSPTREADPPPCPLPTVVAPTPPATIPGYAELDPATGLHMTGTVQRLDLASYRLKVFGLVDHPLELSYDELRCMPRVEVQCRLICPGYFEDDATWAGARLEDVLDLVGVQSGATRIKLRSADGYAAFVSLEEARTGENLLAYEWEGEPLPILHGFPVRAVFPELMGGKWAKWLVEIEVF